MGSKINPKALEQRAKQQVYPHSSTIYAHLVTAEPLGDGTDPWMGDLSGYVSGGNYSYQQLLDIGGTSNNRVIYDAAGTGIIYVSLSPIWANLSTSDNANIVGMIVAPTTSISTTSTAWFAYVERQVSSVASPFTPNGTDSLEMHISTNGWWHDVNVG